MGSHIISAHTDTQTYNIAGHISCDDVKKHGIYNYKWNYNDDEKKPVKIYVLGLCIYYMSPSKLLLVCLEGIVGNSRHDA